MSAPVETVIHEAVGSRFATWVTGLGAPVAARIERLPVPVRRVVRAVVNVPRFLLLLLFGLWRRLVSPLYGQTCKYYPSCSAYGTAVGAAARRGPRRRSDGVADPALQPVEQRRHRRRATRTAP